MDVSAPERLRAAGLRLTKPRLAVLSVLATAPHAETATVIALVRRDLPNVSHQAIYDCLAALTDAGITRRIQPAGSLARYELRVGDNHHHVVCRSCGAVADVDCPVGHAPCLTPGSSPATDGFLLEEAEVIFWGTCAACREHGPTDAPDGKPVAGSSSTQRKDSA
ncbi:Fur family transcriptional regulator [Serinicoccus kebangsaanensis]|uniref:Fur family transcriptional regulator n=1 Tax=Serinicoccus kebangsaanensis TaxID=2602069 RepID=UPI00124C69FF|nr:Fur family transcriptional regulator [Serinicoccus kebangsaanensis]